MGEGGFDIDIVRDLCCREAAILPAYIFTKAGLELFLGEDSCLAGNQGDIFGFCL